MWPSHHFPNPARCSQHQNPLSLLWALLIWSYSSAAETLLQLRNNLLLPLGILQNLLLFFSCLRKESQANPQYSVMGQGSPHPAGGASCLSPLSIPSHQGENQRENQAKGQAPFSPARAGLEWLNRKSFPEKGEPGLAITKLRQGRSLTFQKMVLCLDYS